MSGILKKSKPHEKLFSASICIFDPRSLSLKIIGQETNDHIL